jgi:hypothetical protein
LKHQVGTVILEHCRDALHCSVWKLLH